ncbi:macrophage migration inhibitory factor homolog isoform X1 [Macrobrachium rosenbergii]|uniref:macrophage migration inhibitory factor homolog isoform X1 n=1 Tax=Macrobrachium rosenbergii TaxID=79674 RepID=UPI0034D6523C
MPCLEISTNIPKEKVTSDIILSLSKEIAACLGKPEQYVAVRILPDQLMSFGGTLEPCGTAQLLSIGKLGVAENKVISAKIFALVEKTLGIPNDRMYITFVDAASSNIGYKGTTFHQILGR